MSGQTSKLLLLYIAAILIFVALTTQADAPFSLNSTPGQLPKTVVPRQYEIHIKPNLEKHTLSGSETVEIRVLKPVRDIVLNALEMEVKDVTLKKMEDRSGSEVALKRRMDVKKQTVSLSAPGQIKPGNYQLSLKFTGQMSEQSQGLFYAKYSVDGSDKVMLGTQMESTDARRMFPCWDEPVYRATFELNVVLPQKLKAYSNMPIEKETALENGLKEVRFGRTPSMSSYLVALVAGELEELQDETEGVKLRVVTTEGKKEQGRYALDAAKKLLGYYNEYFGLKYPLPKLDLYAIPGGFSGAMENWGAITFNESLLLFDPKASSQQTKQDIFVTIAHEMSHQWFGDLVTTAWWDNLWLNEGFATWMETKATDHFNPDWEMWLSASAERSGVMNGDAHPTTHAIQQRVENENEASDAFDSITYQKGGALLRMLEDYLGEEVFRKGVHLYLSEHTYSNATTADLWDALEKVSGKPIRKIASGWSEQPGLPIVTVSADCVKGKEVVHIKQERFTVRDPHAKPFNWEIPIAFRISSPTGETKHVLLKGPEDSFRAGDCGSLVKANAGDAGYYRVSYEPKLEETLLKGIGGFPAADRLNLFDDEWALVEAGRTPATNYLSLVEAEKNELTYAIWAQILETLRLIDGLEQGRPQRTGFQEYARRLLKPQLDRMGWEAKPGESANDGMLRGRLIGALGRYQDESVIAEARARFERSLKEPGSLTANIRPAVLMITGKHADRKTYDQLRELAKNAKGTEDRQLYEQAMAAAADKELARETLASCLKNDWPPEEAAQEVMEVAMLGEHRELAWGFAREHHRALLAKVDSWAKDLYLPSIAASFSTEEKADELEAFAKKNLEPDAITKTKEGAEGIRFKAELKKRELPGIERWIAERMKM